MEKKTDAVNDCQAAESGDMPCAADCNTAWQECNQSNPGDKGLCNTKLANCVKDCDSK